ncbi:hypothetical protein MCEMIH15_01991 [Caulobacteraceae bacterium]
MILAHSIRFLGFTSFAVILKLAYPIRTKAPKKIEPTTKGPPVLEACKSEFKASKDSINGNGNMAQQNNPITTAKKFLIMGLLPRISAADSNEAEANDGACHAYS